MSGGDELIRLVRQRAEEGKAIRRRGTKAGPGFELRRIGKRRQQGGGESAQMGDVRRVDDLVEAGVFDGCSDDGAAGVGAGGAGNYIDAMRADDECSGSEGGSATASICPFSGRDGKAGCKRGVGGPGAGAVDELRGVEDACGGADFYGIVDGLRGEYLRVGAQVDGGGANGGEERGGEMARIEAVLVDAGGSDGRRGVSCGRISASASGESVSVPRR